MIPLLRSPFVSAVCLAVVLASGARAQIVYTAPVDLTLTASASNGGAYIIFDFGSGGSSGSARIDSDLSFDDQFVFVTTGSPDFIAAAAGYRENSRIQGDGNAFSANLALGAPIDGSHFSFGNVGVMNVAHENDANWMVGDSGYLGFSFLDGATSNTNYGWARVSYNPDYSLTLHDFAYEASGASIGAGDTGVSAVPEPSTYAALAGLLVGAVAVYARRRAGQPRGLSTLSMPTVG